MYRDLQVLSARPRDTQMRNIPHHLFGDWDGAAACSTAEWAEAAKEVIARLHEDGSIPILVGGTGLYIRTLLDGLSPIPVIAPQVRGEVRALTSSEARVALEREDSEAAARLSPADTMRTMRALEVVRSTGRPIAFYHGKQAGGIADRVTLHPFILLPDRAELYDRCDRRFGRMLDEGAIAEVERLLTRNLDPQLPVMRAIGVREIAAYCSGMRDREAMIEAGQTATRQYAKRQFTWFRNQSPADWPRVPDLPAKPAAETILQ